MFSLVCSLALILVEFLRLDLDATTLSQYIIIEFTIKNTLTYREDKKY